MAEVFLTRLAVAKRYSPEALAQMASQQIRRHFEGLNEPLTVPHLMGLIENSTAPIIEAGLKRLKQSGEVYPDKNGWWHWMNEDFGNPVVNAVPDVIVKAPAKEDVEPRAEAPAPAPEPLPVMAKMVMKATEPPKPEILPSVPKRLRAWLEAVRPNEDPPMALADLAVCLNTNTNTLAKSIKQLNLQLHREAQVELAKTLKNMVIKRENSPPQRIEAPMEKPKSTATALPVVSNEGSWVDEVRERLTALRRPELEKRDRWVATLTEIDCVLNHLDIDATHTSRKTIQEVQQWLTSLC